MKFYYLLILVVCRTVNGSQRPVDLMADLTNDLGVSILRIYSSMQEGNIAFSPYGVASMSVLLYEGSAGNTAFEILKVLNLPWNILLTRIGFRDMNRHLKTYFKSDGFLRGLIMSRDDVCFHPSYQRLLRIYGFDEPDRALTYPCNGFIPYSTSTATYPSSSSTTEAITVSSPQSETTSSIIVSTTRTTNKSPDISTTPITTDDNVVTELTQTSQTVLVHNSTSTPINDLQDINSNFVSFQTTVDSMETGSTMVRTEMTPFLIIADNELITTNSDETYTTGTFINNIQLTDFTTTPNVHTTQSVPMDVSVLNNITLQEISDKIPGVGNITKDEKIVNVTVLQVTPSDTPKLTSTSVIDFIPLESVTDVTKINATNVANKRNLTEILKIKYRLPNDKIINKIKDSNNFTNFYDIADKSENSFQFNSTKVNFTFPDDLFPNLFDEKKSSSREDKFFSSTLFDTKTFTEFPNVENSTLFNFSNFTQSKFTPVNNTGFDFFNNTSFKFRNGSIFKKNDNFSNNFFNLSTNFDFLNNFSVTPINQSIEAFNANETSTFYNTLVDFIESTTQKVQDLFAYKESNSTTESIVSDTSLNYQKPEENLNNSKLAISTEIEKNNTNTSAADNELLENQLKRTTDSFSEGNVLINDEKVDAAEHKFSEKSVTEDDKKSIPFKQKPANYVNVLSLKRSKLLSTKFNVKGIKSFKDSKLTVTTERTQNPQTIKCDIKFNMTRGMNCNSKSEEIMLDSFPRNFHNKTESSNNQTSFLNRKIRSYNYDFWPYNTHEKDFDWFSTLNSQHMAYVPTFTYSAVLRYAYINDLKAKILEVPLDDRKYSILLLLPTHRHELNHILGSLRIWSIRKICSQLQKMPVYAVIPKFNIVSHINLKPALYALGMRDIFYRYRADLSVMSPDARLFVRGIEQVVTIHVDKFPNAADNVPEWSTERYFSALHPFLYFVIDKESEVSLVAGIMTNPSKQQIMYL